jgi:hypothetical protein
VVSKSKSVSHQAKAVRTSKQYNCSFISYGPYSMSTPSYLEDPNCTNFRVCLSLLVAQESGRTVISFSLYITFSSLAFPGLILSWGSVSFFSLFNYFLLDRCWISTTCMAGRKLHFQASKFYRSANLGPGDQLWQTSLILKRTLTFW